MVDTIVPASNVRRAKRANSKPGRVDLIPQEFENLIEDQGIRVRITPSTVCPNRTELEDTNHKLDCPLCHGSQILDIEEACKEDWAFIQSINLDKKFDVQGVFDMKDAQISFRQATRVGYFYKIEVLDFASIFNEVVKRRGGNVDALRYTSGYGCDTPYLLVDSKGQRFTLNEHYRINGREIVWLTSYRPDVGTLYTFLYPVTPTFRVIEMLHENRYYYRGFKLKDKQPVNLPQQALIRLDYIANKAGQNILKEAE